MNARYLVAAALIVAALPARAEVKITPDVVYGHKHGLALTYDVYKPEKPNGAAVLFMVSGGWYSMWAPPESIISRFQPLLDKGFTVFSIRHGSSPKFGIPEAVEDVRLGVRHIRHNAYKYGIESNRLGVFGLSAGGHLSLMLGTTSDKGDANAKDPVLKTGDAVQAVCAWVAPTDLRGMVWSNPTHDKMYDRFPALELDAKGAEKMSPLVAVTPDDAPTLLIAGDKDDLVPIKHSKEIKKAFDEKNVPCEFMVIKGAGHGFNKADGDRATAEMVKFFEAKLGSKSSN